MKKYFLLVGICLIATSLQAQFRYVAANTQNTTGTYTDLGVSGTAVTTNFNGSAMTFDDDNSSIQNIGFSFIYNGISFTQFVLNSNGFIALGTTAPVAYTPDVLSSGAINTIAAFNTDLDAGTTPEYRVFTSGAVGSRVCIIQYEHLRDYEFAPPYQYANINFQIKLYETSNVIELVYGSFTASAASPSAIHATVGIKAGNALNSVNATKAVGVAWASATFINGSYTGDKFENRNNVLPATGKIVRFNTAVNDAKTETVYSLYYHPIPWANPHTIQAMVKNNGETILNDLPVKLSVTGPSTFTSTKFVTLLPNESTVVDFGPYLPTAVGDQTITVSVPADDVNGNNAVVNKQKVNANTFSYANESFPTEGAGWGVNPGMLFVKYKITGTDTLTMVRVRLSSYPLMNVGDTLYAVVMDAGGNIIARSDTLLVYYGHFGSDHEFILHNPPILTNTEFYVGLAQTANPAGPSFPIATQTEAPSARPGTYYYLFGLDGGLPFETTSNGRLMISAVLNTATVPLNEFEYDAEHSTHFDGVYTDLGSSGTAITTNFSAFPMTFDDDNSSVQNIGFNFTYNGKTFSQFVLNSNGFIKLGAGQPIPNNYDVLSSNDSNTIAPFNYDLDAGTGTPEYRVFISGSPGTRICTIQFKNLREWSSPHRYNNINFQIRLYETGKKIEFVYGNFTSSGGSFVFPITAVAGLKGSYNFESVNYKKAGTDNWGAGTFINGPYTGPSFDNDNTELPFPGFTIRFAPAKDAEVKTIYTFGKIPSPFGTYNQVVTARIENTGSVNLINLPVTLNITGSNTFTDVKSISLPAHSGGFVEFTPATSWTQGNNTVTVSVPADDNNTNNSKPYNQVINDTLYSYSDTSSADGSTGYGTGEGILFASYPTPGGDVLVTHVRVRISTDPANVGKTVWGVMWDGDNLIYSDPYVILVGDLGNDKIFKLNNPAPIGIRSGFYVGLKQSASASAYYPVSYQHADPFYETYSFPRLLPPYNDFFVSYVTERLMIDAIVKPAPYVEDLTSVKLLAWDFTGVNSPNSATATTYHPALSSSNLLTRGSAASASPGFNSFLTTGFQNNGIATGNNDYFQFAISPKPGDTLDLKSIQYAPTGDSAFNAEPDGVLSQLAYSLNGTTFTLIGTPEKYWDYNWIADLSTIPALQNIKTGTTVTFRYYASGLTSSGNWGFYSFFSGFDGLKVTGIVRGHRIIPDPVVPTGADYTLANCSSTASGSIHFISVGTYAPGNVYTAKINTCTNWKDTLAVSIGSLASTANSGTINLTIPADIKDGSYKLWIESSAAPDAYSVPSKAFGVKHLVYCPNQNDYFRSVVSGNWNNPATWEVSSDKTTWVASTLVPNEWAAEVEIRVTDTVTITTHVNIRNTNVLGKIKLLNGGANNGVITFFKKETFNNSEGKYSFSMNIHRGGILQVVSATAIFDSLIKRSNDYSFIESEKLITVYGMITIGDGTSTMAAGFHSFATRGTRVSFWDSSIFEWNTTSSNIPASNATYFVAPHYVGYPYYTFLEYGHPILRITKLFPGNFGGSDSTIVNGILEVNTPVVMAGSGKKVFADGITGSSSLVQAPGSGEFKTTTPYTVILPTDTTGAIIGIMDGNINITLSNEGLTLGSGITVKHSTGDVRISGPSISYGKIEVQPGGRMTIDPGSTLVMENADLANNGTIDGPGIIRFTGPNLSSLSAPGTINAKIELSNKQLYLDSNANTNSIDLFGGSNLRLDGFNLNMRTGILSGDASNFIITNDTGRLIRNITAGTDVPFYIGINSTSYTPITITNTGAGTPDNFNVRVGPGVFKDTAITHGNVNRTWFVSDFLEGGNDVKLKMQWKTTDEQPGFLRSSSYISQAVVCPPPINCAGGYFDVATVAPATSLGSDYFTMLRTGIDSFRTNAFIITSTPFIYTFTGNGDWNNANNWTPGIVPPAIIPAGVEVVINHSTEPGSQCFHTGNITVELGGKLTVLPGKTFRVVQ